MIRTRSAVAIAAIAVALGFIAAVALHGTLVYYRTPSEVANEGAAAIGQRMRLGGSVVADSVHRSGDRISFDITDGTNELTVFDTSAVPELFGPGKSVVVEGFFGSDGTFHADTVLVGHDDVYAPPSQAPIVAASPAPTRTSSEG